MSLIKHHPLQSGVLHKKEFLACVWASFNDFDWCFSKTSDETSWKVMAIAQVSVVVALIGIGLGKNIYLFKTKVKGVILAF